MTLLKQTIEDLRREIERLEAAGKVPGEKIEKLRKAVRDAEASLRASEDFYARERRRNFGALRRWAALGFGE